MGKLADLERALARRSFADFCQMMWSVVEQSRPLLPSVAVDGIAATLQEAGEHGGRWAIACPPGVSKSLLAAVFYPAWLLLRSGGKVRVMVGSYSWDLAQRDSMRCRDLVTSAEYRTLVNGAWSLREDGAGNTVSDWWTTSGGRRLVASVGGKALGERVDVQVIDDALSGADVHSQAKRREAARWINEVLPSRLDDPRNGTRVLIGQRLHVEDPHAVVLEQGWKYLSLPALATDSPCELKRDDGTVIWRDPRQPGEPLFELLGAEALERLKQEHGSRAFQAMYQQAPQSVESSMFQPAWWRFHRKDGTPAALSRPDGCATPEQAPAVVLPAKFDQTCISLDAAFRDGASNDFVVFQVWGGVKADRFLLEQRRARMNFTATCATLKELAAKYRGARILVEGKANGDAVVDSLKRDVPGLITVDPQGGKEARAAAVVAQVESGNVYLPEGAPWLADFVDEFSQFPGGKHDDSVDSCTMGLAQMASRGPTWQVGTAANLERAMYKLTGDPYLLFRR